MTNDDREDRKRLISKRLRHPRMMFDGAAVMLSAIDIAIAPIVVDGKVDARGRWTPRLIDLSVRGHAEVLLRNRSTTTRFGCDVIKGEVWSW